VDVTGPRRWSDLTERQRRLVMIGATYEAILKIVALVDLKRRPADQVRGPKWLWAVTVFLVNSLGAVPLAYFRFGRKAAQS
jgi:hypothetical protein